MNYVEQEASGIFLMGAAVGVLASLIIMSTGVIKARLDAAYYRRLFFRHKFLAENWEQAYNSVCDLYEASAVSKPYEAKDRNPYLETMIASDQPEMCGGCGSYLSPEEIALCPGEACSRFKRDGKKINIGYTGHLHTAPNSVD